MEYIEVQIKNLQKTESFQLDVSGTVETLINLATQKFRFPSNARAQISAGGIEYNIMTPIKELEGKQIMLEYYHAVPLKFSHQFLRGTTISTNVLGTQFDLENAVQNHLALQYNVRLVAPPTEWDQRISGQNLYEVVATFFIFYQENFKFFTIDVFEPFEIIYKYIEEFFTLTRPFKLLYNKTPLEENKQYYQYLIPDNSELQIIFKDKIPIIFELKGVRKSFRIQQGEKVDKLKTFLRKQFKIPNGIDFNLEYQNKTVTSLSAIKDNSLILIRQLDYEIKLLLQYQDIEFPQIVRSNQRISDLDAFCQSNKVRYFKDQIELDKNQMFKKYFIEGADSYIRVQLPDFKELEICLQHKYIPKQLIRLQISTNQTIEDALMVHIPHQQQYSVYFNNSELNPKLTFEEIGIKEQDVLIFYLHKVKVGVIHNMMLEYYEINLKWTGNQITEFLGTKLKLKHFKIQYDEIELPLETAFEIIYKPDLILGIECQNFTVKIQVPAFDTELNEVFDQKTKIADIKELLRKQFEIPEFVGVFITYQDQPLIDNVELQTLDLDSYPLSADFESEIEVSFVDTKGQLIKQICVSLGDQVVKILKEFQDLTKVQCYHNNTQINIEKTFFDLNIQQNDRIQVTQAMLKIILRKKENFADTQQFVQPSDTLKNIFSTLSSRQAKFYIDNQQIDQEKPFSQLGIQDDQIIIYETLINVTFTRIKGTLICTRVLPVNTLLVNSLKGVCNSPVVFFYNNIIVDLNKSFQILTNHNDIEIAFEEKQQIITINDELQQVRAQVNITLTLQDLIKKIQFNVAGKSFYDGDSQLENTTPLYKLFNEDNEIVLFFRGPYNGEQSLFLPSQMIKQNHLKIIVIDTQTETRYNESIERSHLVKDFIDQFQNKCGLQNVMLFFEGLEMKGDQTFEQLKIPNGAEIELQY